MKMSSGDCTPPEDQVRIRAIVFDGSKFMNNFASVEQFPEGEKNDDWFNWINLLKTFKFSTVFSVVDLQIIPNYAELFFPTNPKNKK